jgi:hypothetical protein
MHQHFSEPELVELGCMIGLTPRSAELATVAHIDHHQVLAGTTASMAPGYETAEALSQFDSPGPTSGPKQKPTRRKHWKLSQGRYVAAALLAVHAPQADRRSYPNKPVQMIVAFTPGSAVDIVGRIVAEKLSQMWGQPVVSDKSSRRRRLDRTAVSRARRAGSVTRLL